MRDRERQRERQIEEKKEEVGEEGEGYGGGNLLHIDNVEIQLLVFINFRSSTLI